MRSRCCLASDNYYLRDRLAAVGGTLMSNQIESKHAATVLGFVRGAAVPSEHSVVSSAIGASWRRCMIDYSLDPQRPLEHCILDGRTLQEYRTRHEHLIQVASAEIDWLYDHIAMS